MAQGTASSRFLSISSSHTTQMPKRLVVDADEGLVHELEHVALGVREAEEELLGVGVRGLVRDVLRAVLVGFLAVGLVLLVGLQDLLLLLEQLLPEALDLLLFHAAPRSLI